MKLIYLTKKTVISQKENTGKVCYLGFDFKSKEKLVKMGFDVIDTREIITDIAHKIKYRFIDYITETGKTQSNEVRWWASRIASKSNLQTDFFSILCLLFAFRKISDDKISTTVVIDDFRVFFLIKENFIVNYRKRSLFLAKTALLKDKNYLIIKSVTIRLLFFFQKYIVNQKTKVHFNQYSGENIYLYSWVEDRSFNEKTKIYKDPYFPDIGKYNKRGNLILFCPYYVSPKLLKRFSSDVKLDGLSNYSTMWKVVKSIFYFFRPSRIKKFSSFNLNVLWQFEGLTENTKMQYISNVHDYFCWREFFQKNKGKIVYPYENQPWEKVMILANNRKRVKLIGVIHTTIHKILLPFHTTNSELTYMPVPDVLITNSRETFSVYHNTYHPIGVDVFNGGSLRFNNKSNLKVKSSKDPVIGIMLSCILSQTLEQLSDIEKNAVDGFQYLIKPHPDLKIEIPFTIENIKVYSGGVSAFYNKVDAIVYCSSTSGMEAYALGLPVFRIRTQFLDLETGEDSFVPVIISSVKEINKAQLAMHPPVRLFSEPNQEIWKNIFSV